MNWRHIQNKILMDEADERLEQAADELYESCQELYGSLGVDMLNSDGEYVIVVSLN